MVIALGSIGATGRSPVPDFAGAPVPIARNGIEGTALSMGSFRGPASLRGVVVCFAPKKEPALAGQEEEEDSLFL